MTAKTSASCRSVSTNRAFSNRISLPRRRPNILHLRRLVQKLMAFALLAIHPIARQAVADPRPLHVHGKLLELLQIPNHVHHFLCGNAFQQLCHPPFQFSLRNFVGYHNAVMHPSLCGVLMGKRKVIPRIKRHHCSMFSRRLSKNIRVGSIAQTHFGDMIDIKALFA